MNAGVDIRHLGEFKPDRFPRATRKETPCCARVDERLDLKVKIALLEPDDDRRTELALGDPTADDGLFEAVRIRVEPTSGRQPTPTMYAGDGGRTYSATAPSPVEPSLWSS